MRGATTSQEKDQKDDDDDQRGTTQQERDHLYCTSYLSARLKCWWFKKIGKEYFYPKLKNKISFFCMKTIGMDGMARAKARTHNWHV